MPRATSQPCVACIGVFDGVHVGHQALVARARQVADQRGLPLVAVTFDPDPMAVLVSPDAVPSLLPIDRRVELLLEAGADRVEVLTFDEELQLTPAADFITSILMGRLHAVEVVIGPDFLFGHRAAGNVRTLQDAGDQLGFGVTVVAMVGDGVERWSATRIRACIADGAVEQAAVGLTRPYAMYGTVVHGDHRGRELGFPTANLEWAGHLAIPADGVYAGFLTARTQRWPAAISVGTNPHFGGHTRRVEAYCIDVSGLDLYGQDIRVEFIARLRGQAVFDSLEALLAQMGHDVDRARTVCSTTGVDDAV